MSRRTPSDVGFVIVVIIIAIALIITSIIYINEPPSQPTNETITTSIDPGKIDPTRLAQAENASRDKERQNLNAGPIDDAFEYVETMETYQPPTPEPEPEPTVQITPESSSENYSSGDSIWYDLAECESGGNWAYNGSSGYDGGLQFLPSTWLSMAPESYPDYAYLASAEQQISVAKAALAASSWQQQWPTCSAELGLW